MGLLLIMFVWIGLASDLVALIAIPIISFISYGLWLYVRINWQANSEFVFRVDDSAITQSTPASICGETFTIPLNHVRHALHGIAPNTDSPSQRLFLIDRDGKQYEATINYHNPLDRIVTLLKQLGISVRNEFPSKQTSKTLTGQRPS